MEMRPGPLHLSLDGELRDATGLVIDDILWPTASGGGF